ncbi:hypothetical protein PTKU64_54150 [Paraburkholderia terrae]|uniref:Uncharacterized protein n=1 Tax=Paraburkholderia terrae TaxID=311230 RepID=A0ABN6JLG0_9BURK|nr:hypothetical protein PTKU64_54150 [Paraburkholderia terrae]
MGYVRAVQWEAQVRGSAAVTVAGPTTPRSRPCLTLREKSMQKSRSLRVTAQLGDAEMSAAYCEQTGRLCILQKGVLLREWFPPNSWIAIASVAGARNWGTRPHSEELRALLESQMSLLRAG